MVDVAKLNEFGGPPVIIPMTPKMRRFLFALLRQAGKEPTGGSDLERPDSTNKERVLRRPLPQPGLNLLALADRRLDGSERLLQVVP